MIAALNFFQNVEKSVCAKALGNKKKIKIPTNQRCPRITRRDANGFGAIDHEIPARVLKASPFKFVP